MKIKTIVILLVIISLVGCSVVQDNTISIDDNQLVDTVVAIDETLTVEKEIDDSSSVTSSVEGSILDTSEMFSNRDLEQSPDLSEDVYIELISHEDVIIDHEGTYVLSGNVEEVTVIVEADDETKVQIILDDVNIINDDQPVINVVSADKVWITSTGSDNQMIVLSTFKSEGSTDIESVIFSKSDLVLNGTGTLVITSEEGNGITSKDDLKITGGTYWITSSKDALEANDSIRIYDGTFNIETGKDALHSENNEDDTLGYIYIKNGHFTITAADDAIRGNGTVQIDGGVINILTCSEGIEGTYLQINGGDIAIYATDDGINATAKGAYDVVIEVNGGNIDVNMSSGDTDGFDANGSIVINAGTINVTANSAFDADDQAVINGGDVTVNGELVTEIIQSQRGKAKPR